MKTNLVNLALGLAFTAGTVSCQSQKNNPVFEHQGDTMTVVRIASPAKYLLLPVQESSNEGQVKLDTGSPADTYMDVRLATDSVEYYVPFALPQGAAEAVVVVKNVAADARGGSVTKSHLRFIFLVLRTLVSKQKMKIKPFERFYYRIRCPSDGFNIIAQCCGFDILIVMGVYQIQRRVVIRFGNISTVSYTHLTLPTKLEV